MRGIMGCARLRRIANEYHRIRLGIGHPGHKDAVHGFVLSDFSRAERDWVDDLCGAMADAAILLAHHEDASFLNKVHLAMTARGWDAEKG